MTKEELAYFDGKEGRKAYVAVNGKVFDLSTSSYWPGGSHGEEHQAGGDLTAALARAPHVRSVIERFPVVAELEEAAEVKTSSRGTKVLLVGVVVIALALALWFLLR